MLILSFIISNNFKGGTIVSNRHTLPDECIYIWKVKSGYSKEMGESTDFVYNTVQGIVYYFINGVLCPYYGKHGKVCTIKDFKFIEVD